MQFELFIQLLTILAIITLAASGVLQAARQQLFGGSKRKVPMLKFRE
ncbi:hypothetical protein [Thiothrix winogradskyi]|uniref:Uncharacterized protein n=1 Tax=Thiothrix winogradskyi TaxID=96472 RepID=A0ABY3STZ6_9GAMM|nr:hypothetical protein [Thiothrix winogradskyi]UJS22948.1 hypothetical protein L2Y54_13460 [Thiothrix winogradskyi]